MAEVAEHVLLSLLRFPSPSRLREARIQSGCKHPSFSPLVATTEFLSLLELARTDWRDALVSAGLEHEDWPGRLQAAFGRD